MNLVIFGMAIFSTLVSRSPSAYSIQERRDRGITANVETAVDVVGFAFTAGLWVVLAYWQGWLA